MVSLIEMLEKMDACQEAIDWINEQDTTDVRILWSRCSEAKWMLWLALKLGFKGESVSALASITSGRLMTKYRYRGIEQPLWAPEALVTLASETDNQSQPEEADIVRQYITGAMVASQIPISLAFLKSP